eukprot:1138728-Pelagomonas_calceolata.AAC.9
MDRRWICALQGCAKYRKLQSAGFTPGFVLLWPLCALGGNAGAPGVCVNTQRPEGCVGQFHKSEAVVYIMK